MHAICDPIHFFAFNLQSNSLWSSFYQKEAFALKRHDRAFNRCIPTTSVKRNFDMQMHYVRYVCQNGKNSIQIRVQYNVIWGREHPNKKTRRFIMYQLFGEIRFTFAGLSRDVRSASPSFWNVTHSLDGKFWGQARLPPRDVVAVVALVVVIVIVVVVVRIGRLSLSD